MIGMIKKNKLSIIVTAHSEGILLHKTLLSVSESVAELKDAGIDYEIIIHVDKVDAKTKAYLDTHPNKEYTIYYSDQLGFNVKVENEGQIWYLTKFDTNVTPEFPHALPDKDLLANKKAEEQAETNDEDDNYYYNENGELVPYMY